LNAHAVAHGEDARLYDVADEVGDVGVAGKADLQGVALFCDVFGFEEYEVLLGYVLEFAGNVECFHGAGCFGLQGGEGFWCRELIGDVSYKLLQVLNIYSKLHLKNFITIIS
jgi:hypothetical protein